MEIHKSILYGSVSGGIGYISTLPLDFIKQHLQTKQKPKYILNIVKENGIKSMFKGGVIGLYSIVPQMAIKFTTFDFLQKHNQNQNILINGFIAGFIDGSFLGPVLSIQSMQQMNASLTYQDSYKLLFNNIKQTHHLIYPMALRNAFYTSMLFGSCDFIKEKIKKNEYTFLDNFFIASLGNIPAVISCSFADVIRANQIKYFLQNEKYDLKYVTTQLYKTYGLRGFYQGIGGLYLNFALRFPLTYALYQYFIKEDFIVS